MKKRLWIYPFLCLIFGISLAGYFILKKQQTEFNFSSLWLSQRKLPEKLAMDGYLSGNIARINHDLDRAIQSYLKVLEKDPDNLTLLNEIYILAMIQGDFKNLIPYIHQIQDNKMLSDYAQIAVAFQKEDFNKSALLLNSKHPHGADKMLLPLVKSWIFAAQNNKEEAIKSLGTLSSKPFVSGYQKILLGVYFNDNDLIQKGINQIGDHPLPSIGYFPLLKKLITDTGNWDHSALNKAYQELSFNSPETAELLIQVGQMDLTVQKGLAESFYLVSSLAADGELSKEESLAANTLALFLDSEKQISLIWGAELSESLRLPKVALSYYRRLKFHSATLAFKEAVNLVKLNKNKEALTVLKELEKTNKTNILLLSILGQAYLDNNQQKEAFEIYNRLIPLLESQPQNTPLIQAYIARATLYDTQSNEKKLLDLQRAQKLDPENPLLLNDLGYYQMESGLIEEGFELVQQANQKKPNDPYILDSLAFGYLKKDQAQIALPFAEKALDLMPQSAVINTHLGDIYAALGRKREAGFQYKKALDLNTDLTENLIRELHKKLQEKKL